MAEAAKEHYLASELEAESERQRAERHALLDDVWESLPASQRAAIQESVIAENSRLQLAKLPGMLHRLCLDELEKRKKLE